MVDRLLRGTIDLLTDPRNPRGCLMVQGALACGEAAGGIREELASHRIAAQAAFRRRFERARAENDLPAGLDPDALASFVAVIIQGMCVQAAAGASREDLQRIAKLVPRVWPA